MGRFPAEIERAAKAVNEGKDIDGITQCRLNLYCLILKHYKTQREYAAKNGLALNTITLFINGARLNVGLLYLEDYFGVFGWDLTAAFGKTPKNLMDTINARIYGG